MAGTERDLLTALWINVVTTVAFLVVYVILKNLPVNFRVYYPRLCLEGQGEHVDDLIDSGDKKQHGVGWRSHFHFVDSMLSIWRTTETEFIERYGLDSAVLLRTFLLGLKVFVPLMVWGFVVLVPVNKTDNELASFQSSHQNVTYSRVDTLSIANVHDLSERLWAHLLASYLYTIWTCVLLYTEYSRICKLRLDFIANQKQRPDLFTVLVRQVPKDKSISVGRQIQDFFQENHAEYYCTHQVVYEAKKLTKLVKKLTKCELQLELINKHFAAARAADPEAPRPKIKEHWYHFCFAKSDAIDFYAKQIFRLRKEVKEERSNVLFYEKHVVKAGFVSFHTCWGAAVCAQTQQSRDHTKWVTEWAPEPRDVHWRSLSLNLMQLNAYRLMVNIIVVALIIFFFIPVTFVQSLANLDTLVKYFPFLKPLIRREFFGSFFQGYLPGLLLRVVVVLILPPLLRVLTKFEGHISYSKIDKYAAMKYYIFMVVNVFFGNVLIGSLLEQLRQYIAAPATLCKLESLAFWESIAVCISGMLVAMSFLFVMTSDRKFDILLVVDGIRIPKAFGISIPMKATFFMSYIMVDGWANTAAELLRIWPLLIYYIRTYIVRNLIQSYQKHRVKILPVAPPDYTVLLTRLSLYFLLGLVYAVISPLILPFLCIYFAFAYLVQRNQVINVYEPRYERAGSFWPFIHRNIIIALIITHITLMGLFSIKKAVASTPFLLPLPILTIVFHLYCGQKFLPAFKNYPLQEAKWKDKMNADVDIEDMLDNGHAYLHPAIRSASVDSDSEYPDTIRNGTAPQTPSVGHVGRMPSGQSSGKDSWSIPIHQEGSGSNSGPHGRFNHVNGGGSSAKVLAGNSLPSSPSPRIHNLGSRTSPFAAGSVVTPHSSFRSLPTDLDVACEYKGDI